jgi:hypothetical protein
VADHALDDPRRPGVVRDAVEAQLDLVEEAEAESVGQAAPTPQTDVDAASLEASVVARHGRNSLLRALEPYEVRFRLVKRDGEILAVEVELVGQELSNVTGTCVARQMHRPRHEGARLPVACVAVEVEGVGDENCFHIRALVGVADRHDR